MMRLWPRSVMGQFLAVLLGVVLFLQAMTFILVTVQHRSLVRHASVPISAERAALVYTLLKDNPARLRDELLPAVSNRHAEYTVTDSPVVTTTGTSAAAADILRELRSYAGPQVIANIRVEMGMRSSRRRNNTAASDPWRIQFLEEPMLVSVSMKLPDGAWLNMIRAPRTPSLWAKPLVLALGGAILVALLSGYLTTQRIARPLAALRRATEQFGRGQKFSSIPEEGPADTRQVISSFNQMQERLTQFVEDRTRMLAAISHDLRTPVASLRLKAEFIAEEDVRNKVFDLLDEMGTILDANLSFAKLEASDEETQSVDVAGLLQSLAEDHADIGQDVTYHGPDRLVYPCRYRALFRALRNIVENAVRYGKRARLYLSLTGSSLNIIVDDDGPGIPETQLDRVFKPFVRLETSRNKATGGVGLGLAIARTIIKSHGGGIEIANRAGAGLQVTVSLPRAGEIE